MVLRKGKYSSYISIDGVARMDTLEVGKEHGYLLPIIQEELTLSIDI